MSKCLSLEIKLLELEFYSKLSSLIDTHFKDYIESIFYSRFSWIKALFKYTKEHFEFYWIKYFMILFIQIILNWSKRVQYKSGNIILGFEWTNIISKDDA